MHPAITLNGQSIIYQVIDSTYIKLGVNIIPSFLPIINGTVNISLNFK